MKVINYLLVLLFLFSLTSQDDAVDEIRKKLLAKIKILLKERGSYQYKNEILSLNKTLVRKFLMDQVELDDEKINEIGRRYNIEKEVLDQIKITFFQSQPNIYKDFQFSLKNDNLNQIVDFATFSEYIGCCFKQGNLVNYIILRLSVKVEIKKKYDYKKRCARRISFVCPKDIERIKQACQNDLNDSLCKMCSLEVTNFYYVCNTQTIFTISRPRPLNDAEKSEANNLVRSYSRDIFNIMIEESEKETLMPDKKAYVQSTFTTGQTIVNQSHSVVAKITEYGDIEIYKAHKRYRLKYAVYYNTKCLKIAYEKFFKKKEALNFDSLISKGWCKCDIPCEEKSSEYLIADKDGESSCTKLKELKNEKKKISMEVYSDGSLAIKSNGGIIFFAKPDIQGKGPFTVGVSKDLELQVIDSQKVVVWKSTPVYIRRNK